MFSDNKSPFIIAGLGNPGRQYELTRHNAGFMVISLLSSEYNIKVAKISFKALIGEGTIEKERVLLVKPQTFMNESGISIREVCAFYKTTPERLILIYDDVDLPIGTVRVRPGGSSGTHNGMRSVIYQLGYDNFTRIRLGIGKAPEGWELSSYVLGKWSDQETEIIKKAMQLTVEAIPYIIKNGVDAAMAKYNSRKETL